MRNGWGRMRKWCDSMRFGEMLVADRPTQHAISFHRPRFRYRPIDKKKRPDRFLYQVSFYLLTAFLRACQETPQGDRSLRPCWWGHLACNWA
jgi:hypothetical protein